MFTVQVTDCSVIVLTIGRSLPQEDIPARLRCANCNKLAIDAVKLPCCDQSLCLLCKSLLLHLSELACADPAKAPKISPMLAQSAATAPSPRMTASRTRVLGQR